MTEWISVIGNVANMIATALAAFSIMLTIKMQKENNAEEKIKFKGSQHAEWYKEIVLNDILVSLNEFIESTNASLAQCSFGRGEDWEGELRRTYRDINDKYRILNGKFYIIRIFSSGLYNECDKNLQNIMDQYCEAINAASTKKYIQKPNGQLIQKERIMIVEKLYKNVDTFYC